MATRIMSETFENEKENTWAQNVWLKLTHVFSLEVESPSAAVGKGENPQEGRFQGKNQPMVQIVKDSRLRRVFGSLVFTRLREAIF